MAEQLNQQAIQAARGIPPHTVVARRPVNGAAPYQLATCSASSKDPDDGSMDEMDADRCDVSKLVCFTR